MKVRISAVWNSLKPAVCVKMMGSLCLFILALTLAGEVLVSAQTIQSVIFGTVADPSGAVLTGVQVTATNLGNGATSHATTNSDGTYVIPSLLPGKYRIEAEATGFAKQSLPSFDLLVAARSQVDFKFQMASSTTNVTVTAQATAIDTGSASIGQVIEDKTITDLPLNGRNFLQLVLLSAGASPLGGSSDVAGAHGQSLNISGGRESSNQFTVDGVFDNAIHFEGLNLQPSVDAIQEFKVQRNTFNAEFGHGQAIVNLVTKSGGNQFHGTAYEFLRNDKLDAKQYRDVDKPPYRQNQFGFTFGGPLSHNTYFFGGYEGFRSRRSITNTTGILPTAANLSGDFSGSAPVNDPQTGMPFPGNQIPEDRFSEVTKRILPFLPQISSTAYVSVLGSKNDFDQYNIRLDRRFNDRDSIFARYTRGTVNVYTPGLIPLTGSTISDTPVNATTQWTHAFSSALLNSAVFGFNRNLQGSIQDGANDPALNVLQFANANNTPQNFGLPTIVLAGYSAFGTQLTLPAFVGGNTYQYGDTLAWVKGKHTLKFGLDIRNTQMPHTPYLATRGQFVFLGVTGNPVADFLLGIPFVAVGAGKNPSAYMSMLGTSFFVQDDFIVSRSLTLNLGLRYDRLSALSDRTRGRLGVFDPNRGVVVPPADVEKDGLVNPDNTNFGPRVGFAWQPFSNGKTVVRGGYGIYYDQKALNEYNFSLGTELGFQQLVSPNNRWDTLFPVGAGNGVGILTDDPFAKNPRVQQYSFGIQQELPWQMTTEIAFVGSNADRVNGRSDINQAVLGSAPVADRRPYQGFASIYAVNDGDYANYNSLQATLQKRATRNLFFLGAYTYSKSLDVQSSTSEVPQNAHDQDAEYGLSSFNQKHRFSFSYNYLLPFGRGQRYGSTAGALAERLIGGWQLNGIYTYAGGIPFSLAVTGVDRSGTGTFGGGVQRANLVSDPLKAGPVAANPDDRCQSTISQGGRAADAVHTPDSWFNSCAAVAADTGTFGTAARNFLIGPPTNNLDFSILKMFTITETFRIDFRAEMFNILNHPQFNSPASDPTSIGTPTTNIGTFGQLLSPKDSRQIQFGLKLSF